MSYIMPDLASCLRLALTLAAALLPAAASADWPMYRHDPSRSNVTDEKLALPLRLAWTYKAAQAPRPAWPEPVKVLNRLDFDYAPHPVIAEGIVCFGSSADDAVRALDLATGAEKWRFIAGGPIRIAPQIAGGKVYFGSDDGFVYCLAAASGELIWKFQAALRDERLIGNERMICRWPVRTGVLVADGVAYCTAGMWSSEGVFVYALDAATGEVIWCNDTSGIVGDVRTLHAGADFAVYGVCPQGALLASDDILLVPSGKSLPGGYDRQTGKLLYYRMDARHNQRGGTWVTIDGSRFYTTPYIWSYRLADGGDQRPMSRRTAPPYKTRIPGTSVHHYEKVSAVVTGGKAYARSAYRVALAGDMLIEGLDGAVVGLDMDSKKELWRAPVEGQAREIAVAEGRLFVATDRGQICCFAPDAAARKAAIVHDPAAAFPALAPAAAGSSLAQTLEQLAQAGIDRGYALVLGDADGSYSKGIALATRLNVVNVLTDDAAVGALREQLVSTTALYGQRIHVQLVPGLGRLPFASYFANAVVVANPVAGLVGQELYRVLRPCGGMLLGPGLPPAGAEALAKNIDALPGEAVRRGRLPGALDWDSKYTVDQRVKWPLRLLWFGGPGPALVMDRKRFTSIGPPAYGRYFAFSEGSLSAVDAYNGTVLWTRPIPKDFGSLRLADGRYASSDAGGLSGKSFGRSMTADAENVYLTLIGYFRGQERERACIQLDARTGDQKKIYGPYTPPKQLRLDPPQTWPLAIDAEHGGSLTLSKETGGLRVALTTTDPLVTPLDRWDLFFDVRPAAARYGLYGRGTFAIMVSPAGDHTAASWARGTGPDHPAIEITGQRDGKATATTLLLPWAELERLAGGKLASFDFGARLSAHDGDAAIPVARRYLFCDLAADRLNNGWATMALGAVAAPSAEPPAVFAGLFEALPKQRRFRWTRPPQPGPESPFRTPRRHPLTGELGPKFFQGGTFGCGGASYSAYCIVKRSTAVGIYDFADDSGMRTFDGVKPGCAVTCVSALGLLLYSEGRGGCECTTSFQTSLALAPVEERWNEDWALYYDLDAASLIQQVALNLGAPGDRRASDGTLWLGFPRIQGGQGRPQVPPGAAGMGLGRRQVRGNIRVPLELAGYEGAGLHRVNSDRTSIGGADRPWIYASVYRGIKKATMSLDFVEPLTSLPMATTPILDGKLSEGEWPGGPQAKLEVSKMEVFLRHDKAALHVAASRPSVIDRKGKLVKWTKRPAGPEVAPYNEQSFELFLSDAESGRVVSLIVTPSGARYDALSEGPDSKDADVKWNGAWQSAAVADEAGFAVEMTIPWKTLTDAGLDRDDLVINFQAYGPYRVGEALRFLGRRGRKRCERFVPLALGKIADNPPRRFTVRLHFAELDDVKPGDRVFDVRIQGKTVLKDFDIVAAAGGAARAVVKTFAAAAATETLTIEFDAPEGKGADPGTTPTLCGLELWDEALVEGK